MARRDRTAVRKDRSRIDRARRPTRAEAPGPRPPARLGGLPWLAWVFVVLAIGDLAWFAVNAQLASTNTLADLASYALRIVASVTAVLMPAVVLARHPDATTRAPAVVFGTILYALVQGLLILGQPLQVIFETVTPASEELPGLVPSAAIYDGFIAVVGAVGLLFIAVGLVNARRHEDRSGPLPAFVVPVAAVLATVVAVAAVARIDLGGIAMSPTLAVYLGSTVVLSVLPVLAWAYLTTVGIRGWTAGEDPVAGWRLVTVAGILLLLALALVNLGGLLEVQDETVYRLYGYAVTGTFALGHLCLLGAFMVGLPALEDDDPYLDDEIATG